MPSPPSGMRLHTRLMNRQASSLVAFLHEQGLGDRRRRIPQRPAAYEGLTLPDLAGRQRQGLGRDPAAGRRRIARLRGAGPPRTPVDLNWEARDLLKTASRQAAGYLAQMRATEALLESRKFDAFNRMSAFVVHDLKNIVTQLSLMMKNAATPARQPRVPGGHAADGRELARKDAAHDAAAARRRSATRRRPWRGLAAIVDKLQTLARQAGRTLEAEVAEDLATRGHDERLERVLGHLVQNALDATPPSGRVWVRVARFSGQVRVEIGDTGQGMSDQFVRTRLFKPFSSTKHSGMGIGTYESAQYIRELGGSIEVDSEVGRGTVLTVLLPLFDLTRGSDLHTTPT
jgi:putative PEP-CTERM system histidine kinase